jgi:tRNA A-37 threonylcarbamoyl transferase component Bud32
VTADGSATRIEDALAALRRSESPEAARAEASAVLAGDPPDGLRARALLLRGIAEHRLDRWRQALRDLVEALGSADRAGDPATRVEILRAIGTVHAWRGQHSQASLHLTLALADAAVLGDMATLAELLGELGRVNLEMRRYGHALELFRRQATLSDGKLDPRAAARLGNGLAEAHLGAGDTVSALAEASRVLAGAEAQGLAYPAFIAVRTVALAHLRAGRHAEARAALAHARRFAGDASYEAFALAAAEAELAAALGEPDAADRLAAAVATAADRELIGPEVDLRLLQASTLLKAGDRAGAARTLRLALGRARSRGLTLIEDTVREAMARLDIGDGLAEEHGRPVAEAFAAAGDGYVLLEKLGAGAFGGVFRAFDMERGREVALKRMTGFDAYRSAERARLLASARMELEAAARVVHPGVARVLGLGETAEGGIYVVQDFVAGPSLRAVMAESRAPAVVAATLRRIALSLAALHTAGVVHRDLKPDNVLCPAPDRPVLVDFGIASFTGSAKPESRGTPGYAAPEQAEGGDTDGRADLYALGVIAFEWLTGRLPAAPETRGFRLFGRRPLADADRTALETASPRPLADLVAALLDPDPARRPATADEAAARFSALTDTDFT